jgi:hypothetical protein
MFNKVCICWWKEFWTLSKCTVQQLKKPKFFVYEYGKWKENQCVRHRTRLKLPWFIYFFISGFSSYRPVNTLRLSYENKSVYTVYGNNHCGRCHSVWNVPDISRQSGCLIFQRRSSLAGETISLSRNVGRQSGTRLHIPEEWPHLHSHEA